MSKNVMQTLGASDIPLPHKVSAQLDRISYHDERFIDNTAALVGLYRREFGDTWMAVWQQTVTIEVR